MVGLVVTFAGNTGSGISVPALVVGGLLFVSGGTLALTAYRLKQFAQRTGGHPDGAGPEA